MLRVSNLTKYFVDQPIVLGASFVLNAGEHIGLVGANGSGKTTLLRLIVGLEQPDDGSVWLNPQARIGYLRQGVLGDESRSMAEILEPGGAVLGAHEALQQAADALAVHPRDAPALRRYAAASAAFEDRGGYEALDRLQEILNALGLGEIGSNRLVSSLSGGQRTRLGLAGLLMEQPELLLLDEPTNHLDVDGLRWLQGFLRDYRGAALLVSHDRAFLDATVGAILELEAATHRVTAYAGGYSGFAAAKQQAVERQWEHYHRQEQERARMEADIRRTRQQALLVEGRNSADYDHGDTRAAKFAGRARAAKVMRKAVARERKLERFLDSEDRVDLAPGRQTRGRRRT